MKKLTFIATLAGIFMAQINSQAQGLYLGGGVGYGMASMITSYNSTSTSNFTTGTASYTSNSISLGSGVAVGIYGGYMLNKNFGLELGIADKFSSTYTATVTQTNGANVSTDNYTTKGGLFRLTPAIRLMIGDGKLQPYTVTGLIIGFPSSVTTEDANTTTNPGITNTSDEIWTYSGGIIWGFHGAIGVVYSVSDKIGIFGELAGNFQNWAPDKSLVTTATFNGTDVLSSMTTSQKETDFVNSYSTSATATPGSPTQSTRVYIPFSSFGINIGVHINLGGNSAATPAN